MSLSVYQNEYEKLMTEPMSDRQRDIYLTQLLIEMEKEYQIPVGFIDLSWEKLHKSIVLLYRRIAESRMSL